MQSREAARICNERADQARDTREEAGKAAEEDRNKSKTISFGLGNNTSRVSTTIKSALRKGSKETIKTYQHELVVGVRVKV